VQVRYRAVIGEIVSVGSFFFNRGVTDAVLKRDGNLPSLNDSMASRAMSFAKMSTDALMTDVGILSITDDFDGIALINLVTSSTDGGSRSDSRRPV